MSISLVATRERPGKSIPDPRLRILLAIKEWVLEYLPTGFSVHRVGKYRADNRNPKILQTRSDHRDRSRARMWRWHR